MSWASRQASDASAARHRPRPAQAAAERDDCPRCQALADSPCRARGDETAAKYHTARFILVPALREQLEVPVPGDRSPGRQWKPGPRIETTPATEHYGNPIRP